MKSEKVFETSVDMNVTQFKSSPNLSPEMSQGLNSAMTSGEIILMILIGYFFSDALNFESFFILLYIRVQLFNKKAIQLRRIYSLQNFKLDLIYHGPI